jgi:hypothetical protein
VSGCGEGVVGNWEVSRIELLSPRAHPRGKYGFPRAIQPKAKAAA